MDIPTFSNGSIRSSRLVWFYLYIGGVEMINRPLTFELERDPEFQVAIRRADTFKLRVVLHHHHYKATHEQASHIINTYLGV